jgi:ATP-dependent Clp protease ATP-binding subunit ClpA
MARVVTELIKRPLADEILFGVLESGGVAYVDVKEGELVIRTERHEKATTKA